MSMLLKRSRVLNEIVDLTKALLGFWEYRYAVIVDSSASGENCIYARQAKAMSANQITALDKLISELKKLTTQFENLRHNDIES